MNWNGPSALKPFVVAIDKLVEDDANARHHDEKNMTAILASLSSHGQTQLLIQYGGKILVGNGRLAAMRRLGWDGAAVLDVTDYFATEAQATAFAIGDNRANDLATWDFKRLAGQLADLPKDALPWTGYEAFEWNILIESSKAWKDAKAPAHVDKPKPITNEPRLVMRPLKVTDAEAAVVDAAIAKIKEMTGDGHMKDGRAIELICGDFLS